MNRYDEIKAVNTVGARYIDGDNETWEVREGGADVQVRQYVISIEDGETYALPYDGLTIMDIPEDRLQEFTDMVDDNASLAELEAAFGESYSPQREV